MHIDILLHKLESRLPELEWKLSTLGTALSPKSLPRGLFRSHLEITASACIAEIKADIYTLARQKSEYGAYYLAQRIQQKINVLIILCHIQANKSKSAEKINFGLNRISTRQQWLQSLEKEINLLAAQQEAMAKALQQMQACSNTQSLLRLQAELGEVEKRLTLAKETFTRA